MGNKINGYERLIHNVGTKLNMYWGVPDTQYVTHGTVCSVESLGDAYSAHRLTVYRDDGQVLGWYESHPTSACCWVDFMRIFQDSQWWSGTKLANMDENNGDRGWRNPVFASYFS